MTNETETQSSIRILFEAVAVAAYHDNEALLNALVGEIETLLGVLDPRINKEVFIEYMTTTPHATLHQAMYYSTVDEQGSALGRLESDSCERGTPGCSVRHRTNSPCATW